MDLVGIDLGKWLYLIIYLFLPVSTLIYLIVAFGLKLQEDPLVTARRHIEQADYWADIAVKATESPISTKSLASLEYTVQDNLNRAQELLRQNQQNKQSEVEALLNAYADVQGKLRQARAIPAM